MELEIVNINDLISPDWNPRHITDNELEKLKKSIDEFGYVAPVIVNKHNNHIVGGNQRILAMKQLGYEEVEVVYIEEPSLEREKALNIALNKISGNWDTVKLDDLLNELELDELKLTGFDDFELELFRNDELDVSDLLNYENSDDDELPDDYMDVTGDIANKNFVVSIGFPSKDEANGFLQFLGCGKRIVNRDTIQLRTDELEIDYGW